MDVKKKVTALRFLYMSHIEALQNVVRLHKASSNAGLEEISSLSASNADSIEQVCSNKSNSLCFIHCFTSFMVLFYFNFCGCYSFSFCLMGFSIFFCFIISF